VPADPEVVAVRCVATVAIPCEATEQLIRGGRVRVIGRDLDAARTIVFRGGPGGGDDVTSRAVHVRSGHFEASVPGRARSGVVDVLSEVGAAARAPQAVPIVARAAVDLSDSTRTYFVGGRRQPSLIVSLATPATIAVEAVREPGAVAVARWDVAAPAGTSAVPWDARTAQGVAAPPGRYRLRLVSPMGGVRAAAGADAAAFTLADHIFPIRGRHDLGQSATNNFGGARGHKGQDMFAACGTRLAAARAGVVKFAATNARAGHYVVISGDTSGLDYVYMHMRSPATVTKGQRVFTGQQLGEVGDSGNADGCHLHFELWQAPGWYTGGTAIDPLALLRLWDAAA
jgi:murein DD-endopeptidase MepM/ murein hydrolase activator NlpD